MNHIYSHVWWLQQPSSSSLCYYLSTYLDSRAACHGVICISELNNFYQFKNILRLHYESGNTKTPIVYITILSQRHLYRALILLKCLSNSVVNSLLLLTWLILLRVLITEQLFLLVRKKNNLWNWLKPVKSVKSI